MADNSDFHTAWMLNTERKCPSAFRGFAGLPVTLKVSVDSEHAVIDLIALDRDARRRAGHASAAMRRFLALADEHGVTVEGSPVPLDGTTAEADLVRWYLGFGFAWDGVRLVREPTRRGRAAVVRANM